MCGIAGYINFKEINDNIVINSLKHRGPNDNGIFKYKNLSLLHTRLAIQDVKNGKQPFQIGDYILSFNGEIYNHLKLRKIVKNHNFTTKSDTETFLALFIEYGYKFLDYCDGMFAFSIFDIKHKVLHFGRDRFGKKPLYFYLKFNKFFFASELNTIISTIKNISLRNEAINSYLLLGFNHLGDTPYENVSEVLPGHVYKISIDTLKLNKTQYFDIIKNYQESEKKDFSKEALLNSLSSSVKDRLLSSDIEVGAFLSGGIDSSIIAKLASKYTSKLKTFSVSFGVSNDESVYAAQTAKLIGSDHREIRLDPSIKDDVENILSAYGEPFIDSSAIPSYYVSRAAKEHVSVVLSGDGADELFGGYRRYWPERYKIFVYLRHLSFLAKLMPIPDNKYSLYNYLYRILKSSGKSGFQKYASTTYDLGINLLSDHSEIDNLKLNQTILSIDQLDISNFKKAQLKDIKLLMHSDHLKKIDISSMANSLEIRSPFLSSQMLDFFYNIPDSQCISGTQTKKILRDIAEGFGFRHVSKLPKKGFEVPLSNWVFSELKEPILDSLVPSSFAGNYVDTKIINQILSNNIARNHSNAKKLWALYSLNIWHSNFVKLQNYKIESFSTIDEINLKNRTKVLLLTSGIGLGGAERVILDICKFIDKANFEPFVLGISKQDFRVEDFRKIGINPKILYLSKSTKSFIHAALEITKLVSSKKIKLIHCHMFHSVMVASFIKIFNPRIKIIFTPHNQFNNSLSRRLLLWMTKSLRSRDTLFSENSNRYFHQKNQTLIPNGINVLDYKAALHKNNSKIFKFIIIGRLEEMKNHKFLLKAFSNIKNENIELDIVGSGRLDLALNKQVEELGLSGKVNFLGARIDIPNLLSKADCLLLPSKWESFPIVLLEAGASRVPIITTPVGSIPEFLDSSLAYLAKEKDFLGAMEHVISNYDEAVSKSNRLFEKISASYDIRSIIKLYESVYLSF